jgi:hypothetical protein
LRNNSSLDEHTDDYEYADTDTHLHAQPYSNTHSNPNTCPS